MVLLKVALLKVRLSSQTGYLRFCLFTEKRARVFWRVYVSFLFFSFGPEVIFLPKLV
jgi:hypothetical protein